MDAKDQKLAQAICDYLQEKQTGLKDVKHVEGLKLAQMQITEAFGLKSATNLSIAPAKLSTIFDVYLSTQPKEVTELSPDAKKQAEDCKSRGNKKMSAKDFEGAIALYTEAIALDAKNPVYFANRAAAHSQNNAHEEAVKDSKSALLVDPKYSKAYSRMGHAYYCLDKYEDAVTAYEGGLALEPDNLIMKQSLATAASKLAESQAGAVETSNASPKAAAPGGGGGFDFASIMSNPNFMAMASQMMNNPAMASMMNNPQMAQMAQNMMSDPSAMQDMMNNPEMARMAQGMMGDKAPAKKD